MASRRNWVGIQAEQTQAQRLQSPPQKKKHCSDFCHKIGSKFMVKCNTWEFRIAKKVQADTVFGFGGGLVLKLFREARQSRQTQGKWKVGRSAPGIEGVTKKGVKSMH